MELLPCQKQASLDFCHKGGRAYLISPVGHGKSLFAAECFRLVFEKQQSPAWYLTTLSALKEQKAKFEAHGLTVEIVDGTVDNRIEKWRNAKPYIVYMTTLEAVSCHDKEWEILRRVNFGMIGIDEADRLTAGASKRNRRLLTLNPPHKLMMTGTELRNGLKDAYFPIMWLLSNPPWRNWTDFKNREMLFNNPHCPHMMTGLRDENYLASLMSNLIIRMTNPDAPKELVAKVINVPLCDRQRSAYEELKKNLMIEAANGTLTISNQAVLNMRLRQLVAMPEALGIDAPSAKEKALLELLPRLDGKTCIFTSFATVATILGKRYGWPVIQGSVSAKERKEIADSQPDILVATSAGERGVDLPWLTNIVSLDMGFTSATMRQRAGRATRYGRKGEARLFLLQSPNTVDIESEAKIVLRKLKQVRKICQEKARS